MSVLSNKNAEVFIPDDKTIAQALGRTTHMAIAAHYDDIEIMASEAILKCFGSQKNWFFGVVVANGAGSNGNSIYTKFSDAEMQQVRIKEQKKAAYVGEYSGVALLKYSSAETKATENEDVIKDIKALLVEAKPEVIYTHNLADRHDTHVSVAIKVIKAIRELPEETRPKHLYGCEVWRSLDWVNDDDRVSFGIDAHTNIAASLVEVYDSQICGGKRYDLATLGRRRANATYMSTNMPDTSESIIYGIDMTTLVRNSNLDIEEFIMCYIQRFSMDVSQRIKKLI